MTLPFPEAVDVMYPLDDSSVNSDCWLDSLIETDDHSDEDTYSFEQSSDTSKATRKRRVRPHRKRKSTVIIPRLFRRDIRRFYVTMLANVHNSHDPNLLAAFFHTYAVDNLVLKRHQHTYDHRGAIGGVLPSAVFYSRVFHENKPFSLSGLSSFVRVMSSFFALYPDQVCRTDNIRIVSRAGEPTSRVEYDFLIAFNLLYNIHPIAFVDHLFEAVGATDDGQGDASSSDSTATSAASTSGPLMTLSTPLRRPATSIQFDPFAYFYEKVGHALPLRAEPLPISLDMRAVMHLDASRRMCRFEMSLRRCTAGTAGQTA
jgi:hypothetical protein